MQIPLNSIQQISEMISELVDFGYNRGIYTNKIDSKDIELNIIETCFKGKSYTSSDKTKFLSVEYPFYYQRKSSSGLLAKTSIVQFGFKNEELTVSFPIHLKNRRVISFLINQRKDTFSFITYSHKKLFIDSLKEELFNSCKLLLRKYKISFEKNETLESIDNKIKVIQMMTY
jgi:hypothetical protein